MSRGLRIAAAASTVRTNCSRPPRPRARRDSSRWTRSRPYPVEDLTEALGFRQSRDHLDHARSAASAARWSPSARSPSPRSVHYPFNVGGRPDLQLAGLRSGDLRDGVLSAALGGAFALAILSRLAPAEPPGFQRPALPRRRAGRIFPAAARHPGSPLVSHRPLSDGMEGGGGMRTAPDHRRRQLSACLLTACDDEMADQCRISSRWKRSQLFEDGTSARTPPAGTVARGRSRRPIPRSTTAASRGPATRWRNRRCPPPPRGCERGRELFNIHCAVCHGEDGYGKGIVVRRGFPPPPSYHSDRLRNAPGRTFLRCHHQRLRQDVSLPVTGRRRGPLGDRLLYPRAPAQPARAACRRDATPTPGRHSIRKGGGREGMRRSVSHRRSSPRSSPRSAGSSRPPPWCRPGISR